MAGVHPIVVVAPVLVILYIAVSALIVTGSIGSVAAALFGRKRRTVWISLAAACASAGFWNALWWPLYLYDMTDVDLGRMMIDAGWLSVTALVLSLIRAFAPDMDGVAIASRRGIGVILTPEDLGMKRRNQTAQPGATDNPDDAERI